MTMQARGRADVVEAESIDAVTVAGRGRIDEPMPPRARRRGG
jgi:hypothetical protein